MISVARVLAFNHIMSPFDVDWLHLLFPQLADRKKKGKNLNQTFHTFECWMRESYLFWSRHAIRRCMEYTVNSFTHFIEGGIFSDVTLSEKGKKINIYLVNVSIIFKKLLNHCLSTPFMILCKYTVILHTWVCCAFTAHMGCEWITLPWEDSCN